MTETIIKLKNIRDELGKSTQLSKADSLEKAMCLCEIAEHIAKATHHLNFAINKLIIYQCFDKQESDTR